MIYDVTSNIIFLNWWYACCIIFQIGCVGMHDVPSQQMWCLSSFQASVTSDQGPFQFLMIYIITRSLEVSISRDFANSWQIVLKFGRCLGNTDLEMPIKNLWLTERSAILNNMVPINTGQWLPQHLCRCFMIFTPKQLMDMARQHGHTTVHQ